MWALAATRELRNKLVDLKLIEHVLQILLVGKCYDVLGTRCSHSGRKTGEQFHPLSRSLSNDSALMVIQLSGFILGLNDIHGFVYSTICRQILPAEGWLQNMFQVTMEEWPDVRDVPHQDGGQIVSKLQETLLGMFCNALQQIFGTKCHGVRT